MAIFTDDFTGTNGADLNVRSGWTTYGSGLNGAEIQSNNLSRLGDADGAFIGQDKGGADHYGQATIGADAVTAFMLILAVRATDRNDFYAAAYNPGDSKWELWTPTTRITQQVGTQSAAAGDVVRLEANGTTITLKINGSTVITETGVILTGQRVGIPTKDGSATDFMRDWESGLLSDVGGGSTFVPQVIMVL